MKKKVFLIFVAILVVVCSVVFVSCNKDKTPTERGNISRTISAFYAGENDNFAVSIQSGKREKNFMADGKATDVVDFTELTILPLKVHDCEEYVFVINGESATLSGKVKGNEFGEYIISVNLDFTPISVTIGEGEGAECISLTNVLDGKLTSADVINIAETEFADRINGAKEAGDYCREIYVKLITGDRQNYYYYVSYIGEGVDYWALLVNPATGEIVSKK